MSLRDTSFTGSAAHRVASLFNRNPETTEDDGCNSLRSITAQIKSFLAMAPEVPAIPMEPTATPCPVDINGTVAVAGSSPYVELNVVAGIFEEQAPIAAGSSVDGLLLPSTETEREMRRRQAEEAQAMLNLMSALTPSSTGGGDALRPAAALHIPEVSSDDEVMIIAAEEMSSSEDDDLPVQRCRVVEM